MILVEKKNVFDTMSSVGDWISKKDGIVMRRIILPAVAMLPFTVAFAVSELMSGRIILMMLDDRLIGK